MRAEIVGAGMVVTALKKFNTGAYKVLLAEVKDATAVMAKDVRDGLPTAPPLSGWTHWSDQRPGSGGAMVRRDLGYNASRARAQVRHGARADRMRRVGTVGVVGWVTEFDPAAAIFMVAGAIPGSDTVAGSRFERILNNRFGRQFPRVMAGVWRDRVKDANAKVDAALRKAAREVGLG